MRLAQKSSPEREALSRGRGGFSPDYQRLAVDVQTIFNWRLGADHQYVMDERPYAFQWRFDRNIKLCLRLRYSEPQLGIEIDVVVPGEDIGGGQLCLRQAHHLGETRPGTAIIVGDAHRSDDRDIA